MAQTSTTDLPHLTPLTGPLCHSTPEKDHSIAEETNTILDPDGIRHSFDTRMPASMDMLIEDEPASFLIPPGDPTTETSDTTVNVVDYSPLTGVVGEGENAVSDGNPAPELTPAPASETSCRSPFSHYLLRSGQDEDHTVLDHDSLPRPPKRPPRNLTISSLVPN